MAKGWDDTTPKSGGQRGENFRISDVMDIVEFAKLKGFQEFRPVGGLGSVAEAWFTIKGSKSGKIVDILKYLPSWDSEKEDFDPKKAKKDYYYQLAKKYDIRISIRYISNVISRAMQENAPKKMGKPSPEEKKLKHRLKGSTFWQPTLAMLMPASLTTNIKELKTINKRKDKKTGEVKTYAVSHPKFGCDVSIKYDKDASGSDKYKVQKGERTPLTEEEEAYLLWPLDGFMQYDPPEVAKKEAAGLEKQLWDKEAKKPRKPVGSDDDDEDEDDEDEDMEVTSSKKKGKKKSSDDDDDDDDTPKKKSKKKSFDDDDDEDSDDEDDSDSDDDEDDDEDEDEKPKKKAKQKGKKVEDDEDEDSDDEDEDSDEDDDDEDEDDEDEKPKKKKGKVKAKKKKSSDDDDDDDDEDSDDEDEDSDDDEDDDEEEKPKKKKGASKKKLSKEKPKKKGKMDIFEDDDDDDSDDDEDDDDDDED